MIWSSTWFTMIYEMLYDLVCGVWSVGGLLDLAYGLWSVTYTVAPFWIKSSWVVNWRVARSLLHLLQHDQTCPYRDDAKKIKDAKLTGKRLNRKRVCTLSLSLFYTCYLFLPLSLCLPQPYYIQLSYSLSVPLNLLSLYPQSHFQGIIVLDQILLNNTYGARDHLKKLA